MKPKQKALKKTDINSAPVKRLLKWITTTVSSTGGVTYTQVKNFVAATEKRCAPNFDVKDVLKNFLENGRLQKVGYKYVIPTSPIKRQIAKKAAEKKSNVKRSTISQDVEDQVKAIKVKRSPGILEVREAKMAEIEPLEGNASEGTMSYEILNGEMPTQIEDARMPTQIKDAGMPTQIEDAGMPTQIEDAGMSIKSEEGGMPTQDLDCDAVACEICQLYENNSSAGMASETRDSEVNSQNVDVELSQNSEVPSPNFADPIEREVSDCDSVTVGTEIME